MREEADAALDPAEVPQDFCAQGRGTGTLQSLGMQRAGAAEGLPQPDWSQHLPARV